MNTVRKFKATGSDALGEALAAALKRSATDGSLNPHVIYDGHPRAGKSLVFEAMAHAPNTTIVKPPPVPPLAERRKREQQGNVIKKHCAVIKRTEPRLLQDLLQTFGSIEGLNTDKQALLISYLAAIRKEYRI